MIIYDYLLFVIILLLFYNYFIIIDNCFIIIKSLLWLFLLYISIVCINVVADFVYLWLIVITDDY